MVGRGNDVIDLLPPYCSKTSRATADPTHHPKQHLDPISRFVTVHFPDRQTHTHSLTQTDRWARRQLDSISPYALYIDIERRANNM